MLVKFQGQPLFPVASSVAMAMSIAGPAYAQQAQSAAAESEFTADEIVVTARQRSENIQTVPIAISAVTAEEIRRTGVKSLTDVSGRVPGLQFGGNGVRLQTFTGIRGVGDYSRNPGFDNRVGIYVDGIYLGRSNATDYPMFDVQQLEVLRGPQGTLFGKDTLTGVINIISTKPTNEFEGRVTLRGGSRSYLEGQAVVNAPISGAAALRISAFARDQHGYVKNLSQGSRLGGGNAEGGRVQLRIEPSSNLTADISVDYVHDKMNALGMDPIVGTPQGDQAPKVREVNYNNTPTRERDIFGVSLTLEHELGGGFALTSITAYRTAKSSFLNNDLDLSSLDLATNSLRDKSSAFSQEIRLASPGGGQFEYVLGAFYYYDRPRSSWRNDLASQFPAPPLQNTDFTAVADVRNETLAAFAHGSFKVADMLVIDGGLRLNHVKKKIRYDQHLSTPVIAVGLGFPEIADYRDKVSETWVDPLIGVRVPVSDAVNLYATFTTGRRPAGWNADFVQYTDIAFGAEKVKSYELGIKTQLFDRAVRFNLAAYQMDFDDMQINQFLTPPGSVGLAPTLRNAGAARSKGIETEILARLGQHFEIGGAFAYNDAKFTRFDNGDGAGTSFAGNRLIQAPKWLVALNGQLHFPIRDGEQVVRLSADYRYQSKTFSDPSNAPTYEQPGNEVVGARLSIEDGDSRWEIGVFARNLFDVTYAEQRSISGLRVPGIVYNEPRTIGAEATFRF